MATNSAGPSSRSSRAHWIGIATALMCALAGGAVWCLLALYARTSLIVLALPIAATVVWALRSHGYASSVVGAAIGAFAVALACAYSLYLQASAEVAALLGLPLRAALTQMDPAMAIDIAWADLDATGLALIVIAIAIAIVGVAWRRH